MHTAGLFVLLCAFSASAPTTVKAYPCWAWQTDWSTACTCERPCWCLVPDEVVTPGPYQGELESYYLCDSCPCLTEGLFNPGDGPVLGDADWPFPGQGGATPAVAGDEGLPLARNRILAIADEEGDGIDAEDITDAIDNAVGNAIDEVTSSFWDSAMEGLMAWDSPIFS